MALIERDLANAQSQVDPTKVFSPSDVADSEALKICVQDAETAGAWFQNSYWGLRWKEADALYQSPPGIIMWEGTNQPKANVNRFTVAETVNAIHPQIMNGLFYEEPAFMLRPQPNQDPNTTRAISALISEQLREMEIRLEVDLGIFSALIFGTAIFKWGFKSFVKKTFKYMKAGEGIKIPGALPGAPEQVIETSDSAAYKKVENEIDIHIPTFENKDVRYVLVDPGCRVPDIRKAKFVIDRVYKTYHDLMALKDEEYVVTSESGSQKLVKRYDLPSEETIKSWFEPPLNQVGVPPNSAITMGDQVSIHHAQPQFKKTTADPLDEPLEVLERWDNNKVITVLQRVKVIRNEPNEWNEIPFLSVNWWNIPDAFYGLGLGRVIGVEQRVQAGLINACLDLASLIVNPMYIRARGANIQTQQIRQRIGGIIDADVGPNYGVKSAADAFHMLTPPVIPSEIIQQIAMSQARVERTSGANEQLTMGATPGSPKSSLGRSGTGAAGIIQATMNRIGGFAEAFVRQVYEPLLYKIHEMNKDKLPTAYIQKILGDKLGEAFKLDMGNFLNSHAQFEVLAGSHLAAKAQMAQSLFVMLQTFESAPLMDQLNKISNKKVNIEELFHMIHDVSGWKNYYKIIEDMTPEEKARMEANSPAAAQAMKLQGQAAMTDKKFSNDQKLVDQENEARVVRDMFREILKHSTAPTVPANPLTGA